MIFESSYSLGSINAAESLIFNFPVNISVIFANSFNNIYYMYQRYIT